MKRDEAKTPGIPEICARIRPHRHITGMSAVLLPFDRSEEIDWRALEAHVERTASAGLTPAVNMDTGYVQLLDDATRLRILEAAEAHFSAKGFSATRLEDIAESIGIRRAALFYYFRDKRALYAAVLEGVFGGLLDRLRTALTARAPLPQRIERAVSTWVLSMFIASVTSPGVSPLKSNGESTLPY